MKRCNTPENAFVTKLITKYNYPKESIKTNVRVGTFVFDVVIQKGNMYVQAFEVKANNSKPDFGKKVKILSQKINDISVDTPLYCAIYDQDKQEWILYSASNLKKPIDNIEHVLNYREAVVKFLGQVRERASAQPKELPWICWCSSIVMFAYLVFYLLCDYCIIEPPALPSPLSSEFLIYVSVMVFLLILPSLLKLLNNVKRIKISIFELELKEKLELW